MEKFDGVHHRPLTAPEVKQIAGRAGRFGSKFQEGQVTCLNQARMLTSSLQSAGKWGIVLFVAEGSCLAS